MKTNGKQSSEAPACPHARSSGSHAIDHAAALRAELEAPIRNKLLGCEVGRGELDYEVYLKTSALLSLQHPTNELVIPEELMFQVVHQTQELWMKLFAHEAVVLVAELDDDALPRAAMTLERMTRIAQTMGTDIRVLDTLTPAKFLAIRRHLGDGSGQQSPGFNKIMVLATGLERALARLLARHRTTLEEVYSETAPHPGLLMICEKLVDLDELYQQWLVAHYHLVRRTMGVDRTVHALDGLPSRVLVGRMTKPLIAPLWDVRVTLTNRWTRAGGHAPGAPRCPFAQQDAVSREG
jgi:tryptophan 2,3-dioxygenase